jgi:DNA modification methylase
MENTIFNESCLDTMSRMADNSIDLVVTSPPYFNAREYSQYSDVSSYMETMRDIFTEIYRVLGEARFLAVNISPVLVPREKRSEESRRVPPTFLLCAYA